MHCRRCRKRTHDANKREKMARNGTLMHQAQCGHCGATKTRFVGKVKHGGAEYDEPDQYEYGNGRSRHGGAVQYTGGASHTGSGYGGYGYYRPADDTAMGAGYGGYGKHIPAPGTSGPSGRFAAYGDGGRFKPMDLGMPFGANRPAVYRPPTFQNLY